MQKILITGGYGNLGSWLSRYLSRIGHQVTILSKYKRNIPELKHLPFIACDITAWSDCRKALTEKFDTIIHLASANDSFIENYPSIAHKTNIEGTQNVLRNLPNPENTQFIYLSTFQVYGTYEGHITEDHTPSPKNPYAETHLSAEQEVESFSEMTGMKPVILRLTNSYGCPIDPNTSKWYLILNDLARMAIAQNQIQLKSNGQSQRDFIWMGDVCKITNNLLKQPNTSGTYNLSSEKTYSTLDIAQEVIKAYQSEYGSSIEITVNQNDKSTSSESLFVDSAKLKAITNYQCENQIRQEAKKIFNLISQRKQR